MTRPQAKGWKSGRARPRGPTLRPRRSYPPRAREDDLLARLDRLESLVVAIAAHLGIDPVRPGRAAPQRHEPRPRDAQHGTPWSREERRAGAPDAHAVVRTVARRLSGRVKQYHPGRGYGFVVSPDAPGDVFFHRSDCRADPVALEPSAVVSFDLVEMANGQFKAINLSPREASS